MLKFPSNIPWFMFDINNMQLITSPIIPGDIRDSKSVLLTETPIPGKNFQPVTPAGNGNRKISFTLPLIKRNDFIGNAAILKQFDSLRNQSTGFLSPSKQFTPNPKVLYYWGTGSVPLIYWVKKCDAVHKRGWVNAFGYPQYSDIEIELWLDETHPIYRAEEIWRSAATLIGEVDSGYSSLSSTVTSNRVY